MTLRICVMESADVSRVVTIQAESPEIAQWVASDYEHLEQGGMVGWIAEDTGRAVGFLVARHIAIEIEILNLAVSSHARRQGVGSQLLAAAFEWGRLVGAERAILDVRPSNQAALRLYERHGFRVEGRRPAYYMAPVEDALLLGRSLDSELCRRPFEAATPAHVDDAPQ